MAAAVVCLCSSPQTGDSESNLSCSGAASSSRALIRRPPGLPASVWSSGLSFAFLIPSRGGKKCFDYLLTNKVQTERRGGVWFWGCRERWSLDWHVYWTAFINSGDLSGRLIMSAGSSARGLCFLFSFFSFPFSFFSSISVKTTT